MVIPHRPNSEFDKKVPILTIAHNLYIAFCLG